MNSNNNWLSFPISPTHLSLPAHIHTAQAHQFSLGLVNDNTDTRFQAQEWDLINSHNTGEVPKVADYLGPSKSSNNSDLSAYTEMQTAGETDYMYTSSTSLLPALQSNNNNNAIPSPNSVDSNYDFQENANTLQTLTLSMGSSGKRSTCETSSAGGGDTTTTNGAVEATPRRTLDTFGQRTSIYRGVTRHRWTGRYEAHLWDNSCRREGQSRKGRQVYLGGCSSSTFMDMGGYDKEEKAARAYDLAALKYWGTSTTTNFPINNYERELEEMKHMTRQEFVASIRRKSSGFSRGASMYRGVTRHHQHGRWQARIGRVAGNKDLYLGTFSTEEEAAEAYDIAAIKFRGLNAVTNFDMNRYDVKSILESNTLPIGGGAAKRLKEAQAIETSRKREEMIAIGSASSCFHYGSSSNSSSRIIPQAFPLIPFEQQQSLLTLQNNHDLSLQYAQQQEQTQFTPSYMHSQIHAYPHHQQFYNGYENLQTGLIDMGVSSSTSNGHGGGDTSYNMGGGYNSNNGLDIGMALNQTASAVTGNEVVKVDYDMPPGGYGSWSGDTVHHQAGSSNPGGGVFTMWND